jgi:hypothetical protein
LPGHIAFTSYYNEGRFLPVAICPRRKNMPKKKKILIREFVILVYTDGGIFMDLCG